MCCRVLRSNDGVSESFLGSAEQRLFVRQVGDGTPIIVLHGGADFDHEYLLPDLDRLADSVRLVYFDQRGRGRSYDGQPAADVSIDSKYQSGDIATDLDAYRIHFSGRVSPDKIEDLLGRLRKWFTAESVVAARAIEDRLYAETWNATNYDLLSRFSRLHIPTLVVHGDHDFVPSTAVFEIADAIPGSRLVILQDSGHFSYLDQPEDVHRLITEFVVSR